MLELTEEKKNANFNAFMDFVMELDRKKVSIEKQQQEMKVSESSLTVQRSLSTTSTTKNSDFYRESSVRTLSSQAGITKRVSYNLVKSGIGRLVMKKIPEHLFLSKHNQKSSNIIFRSQFVNNKDNKPRILQNLAIQKTKAAEWTISNPQFQSNAKIDLEDLKMFQLKQYGESITSLQEISRRMLVEYALTNDLPIIKITRNSWLTFQFCVQNQLIPSKLDCKFCGKPMRIVKSQKEYDGCYWRCYKYSRNCSSITSIRSGTIFCHSRITIMEQLKVILHYFVRNFNARECADEIEEMSGIDSYKSIEQIFKVIRQQIHIWTHNHYRKHKLGSFGRKVEIDEALFNTVEKDGNQVWVLGFYERGTKDQRAIYIKDRSIENITQVVLENVAVGAEIYTDYYRGFSGLKQYFRHNIGNSEFGKTSNAVELNPAIRVETMWSQIKRRFRLYGCRNRRYLQHYLDETLWKIKTRVFQDRIDFLLQMNHYQNFSSDLFQTINELQTTHDNSRAANVGAYVVTTEPGLFREPEEYFNYEDSQFNTQLNQNLHEDPNNFAMFDNQQNE